LLRRNCTLNTRCDEQLAPTKCAAQRPTSAFATHLSADPDD
jgi:hypothetical protein